MSFFLKMRIYRMNWLMNWQQWLYTVIKRSGQPQSLRLHLHSNAGWSNSLMPVVFVR